MLRSQGEGVLVNAPLNSNLTYRVRIASPGVQIISNIRNAGLDLLVPPRERAAQKNTPDSDRIETAE